MLLYPALKWQCASNATWHGLNLKEPLIRIWLIEEIHGK